MSAEPHSKRRKMSHKKPSFYQNKAKYVLETGIKGFLATCNFREKDCVRECYNLLNEYADNGEQTATIQPNESNECLNDSGAVVNDESIETGAAKIGSDDEAEEEDIATQLQKEIDTMKSKKVVNHNRFQQCETKVPNCIFIKTTVDDPTELGVRIARDIAINKKRKTRMLLRLIPVDVVCKATIEDIKNQAGKLFDKHFLNAEPTTFSIVINKRYNNNLDRMAIIQELAAMINFKNSLHKVNLKEPKVSVVIEAIKGL